jgi:hypothetical protein
MATISPVSSSTSTRNSVSLVRSTALAGLVIGVLGAVDYVTFFDLTLHTPPLATFQYIASGLLGPAAFAGGYTTALLGLLIHFVIAFVVAGVFILAASWIALVRRTVFLSALVYGAAVNMFMSTLVLPFSAAPKMQVTTVLIVHGLIADAVFVGLPLALIVWRNTRLNNANAMA